MKKSILIACTTISTTFGSGQDMKLINTQTGFVVVEFIEGKPQFHDRFLEAEMKTKGIQVPPMMRKSFENKQAIFLDDPLFEKAFKEIYCPLVIQNQLYQWKK